MKRLLTTPTKGQLKLVWHIEGENLFELFLSRIVIGLSWAENNYAVVVGERIIEGKTGADRYWLVIDEATGTTPQELFTQLVTVKDDYLAAAVISATNPPALSDIIRQTEGLTHYRLENYYDAERRWPSFVGFEHTAALYQETPPDDKVVHQELERWLNEKVYHPDSHEEILDTNGAPLVRLMLPYDFPNPIARTGVQQAKASICQAVWFACSYLERRKPTIRTKGVTWEHIPGKGGY